MSLLIAGIVLWSAVHLFPSIASQTRGSFVAKQGNNAYRGLFSLLILASLVMIVFGWKSATPSTMFAPPLLGSPVVSALVLLAFILFVAAQARTNIKRVLRHPQLTGLVVWAAAHLLANGDSRSVALFGGLGLWAIAEILLINRRDGAWQRPDAQPLPKDIIVFVIAAVAFGLVLYFHQWLFGVSPLA